MVLSSKRRRQRNAEEGEQQQADDGGAPPTTTEEPVTEAKEKRDVIDKGVCLDDDEVDTGASSDDDDESSQRAAADEAADGDDSSDDSEDDAPRNRIGNVPLEWYADEDHVGYDLEGKKIMRTLTTGEIDSLLESKDNPDAWRTIKDHRNQREVVLTDTDLEIIKRIRAGMQASASTDTTTMVEFDNPEAALHPTSGALPPKSRFLPSKWERMHVKRLVALLREGKIRPPPPPKPEVWDLWAENDGPSRRNGPRPLPAPKPPLPGHAESYNPPSEYLFTKEEEEAWAEQDEQDRTLTHLPQKYSALRRVPAYKELITERFKRCLDLYLVPRALKQRMNVDPDSLIPKLPSPKDLRPFPTHVSVSFEGHTGLVRGISVDSTGQWIATVSSDSTLRIWEVLTGRPVRVLKFNDKATAVAWHPSRALLAVAADQRLLFVDPELELPEALVSGSSSDEETVASLLTLRVQPKKAAENEEEEGAEKAGDGAKARAISWRAVERADPLFQTGCRISIATDGDVTQLTWHPKGNYLAAVCPKANATSNQCIVHALKQQISMRPFKHPKGGQPVQSCAFHPSKPHFFVASMRSVRVYDLQKQMPLKQLVSGAKWISSITMHSTGDHVVVGSYDRRMIWFDMDFSSKPYKTLQYHDKAVRSVAFHPGKFPLLACASDDATVSILHAKVFSDLMQSPMIVPVKRLRDHAVHQGLGVLSCVWHPHQPWLFTTGADHRVYLWA